MSGALRAVLVSMLVWLVAQSGFVTSAELRTLRAESADGIEIAYREGGGGEPTIVFVHGWTCDSTYWDAQLPYFTQRYRVVAVDLAGHGASGLGRANYSMERFGRDVAAAAGEGPLVLVGHSMGGPVILQAALQLGDQVVGLVAVDTLRNVAPPVSDPEQLNARLDPLKADYAAVASQVLASMFVESSDPQLQQRITDDMLATDRAVGVGALRGMLETDVADALEQIDAPLVVINSDYQPTELAALQDYHPNVTLHIMEGVGHFVMLEDAETFNRLLEAAIQSFIGE